MAEIALRRGDIYPVGTLVRAYALAHPESPIPPSGAPSGAVVAEATVAATSSLTLTGLTQGLYYVAWANVAGVDRYVRFHLDTPAEEGIGVALTAFEAQKGAASGLAELDGTSRLRESQVPVSVVRGGGNHVEALTLAEVEAKAAALLPSGAIYDYAIVNAAGELEDFGGGKV